LSHTIPSRPTNPRIFEKVDCDSSPRGGRSGCLSHRKEGGQRGQERNWQRRKQESGRAVLAGPDQQYNQEKRGPWVDTSRFHPSKSKPPVLLQLIGCRLSLWKDAGFRFVAGPIGAVLAVRILVVAVEMDPPTMPNTVYLISDSSFRGRIRCTSGGKAKWRSLIARPGKVGEVRWQPLTNGLPQEDAFRDELARANMERAGPLRK